MIPKLSRVSIGIADINCVVCGQPTVAQRTTCSTVCLTVLRKRQASRPRGALSLSERFWEKVNKDGPIHPVLGTPCWVWTAARHAQGYGFFGTGKSYPARAHCVAWTLANGPIPKGEGFHGTCVLHKCDNPSCVNPDHLRLGTTQENTEDMVAKGRSWNPLAKKHAAKTHCIRGHPFDEENTRRGTRGQRECRACGRLHDKERNPRSRA